ncbi:MAG: hypothetical protein II005_06170 [Turicibacter sp.]|jgi:hypothetical protein|nr:hypothetical protein [Turicibacter sp.]MBQ1786295.1 hypothetical protein [Turicibacter sp.]MEE0880502.1 hypothetical protein [Turicibacter sp.]
MELLSIVIVSVIIESAIATFNTLHKSNGALSFKKIGAIVLSICACICAELNLFSILGITMLIPYVGEIITGLVISRGSSAVNSLAERFTKIKSLDSNDTENNLS